MSQATYVNKLLVKYVMQDSNKGFLPFRHGVYFSHDQCPKTLEEKEHMQAIPYASVMGSFMYVMSCTRLNIYFVCDVMFQTKHLFYTRYSEQISIKFEPKTLDNYQEYTLKYFRKRRNYILIFQNGELIPREYIYLNFQFDKNSHQSIVGGNDHCFDDFLKKLPLFLVNRINNDFVN